MSMLFRTQITTIVASLCFFGCPQAPVETPDVVWPISGTVTPDGPLSSAFGPRLKISEGSRYDFHRGIDIPAPLGSDVHAIADGTVRLAGTYPQYSDMIVQITHDDGEGGVYYSNSIHLSKVLTSEGAVVAAGDVIGETGVGDSGFPHLHFEIRDGGLFQRNCVNPFEVLPYADESAPSVTINAIDVSDPMSPDVTVSVSLPRTEEDDELDFNAVTVSILDQDGAKQALVDEHSFDITVWNYEFTPMPPDDPTAILDQADFNGVLVEPETFSTTSDEYVMHFTFHELTGLPDPSTMVVRAVARDIVGNSTEATMAAAR